MTEQELIEQLASCEHGSWARWMCYVFDIGKTNEDGSFTIPKEYVDRWLRQACTDYKELSEREKQSDRDEVAHILPIIEAHKKSITITGEELAKAIQNALGQRGDVFFSWEEMPENLKELSIVACSDALKVLGTQAD